MPYCDTSAILRLHSGWLEKLALLKCPLMVKLGVRFFGTYPEPLKRKKIS